MPALSIKDLDPRNERRLAMLAIAVAVAAMAWTLWRYLPHWSDPAKPIDTTVSLATDADASRSDGSLADHALFGAAPADTAGSPDALPIDAPDTDLALSLRGTLATRDAGNALAIVADSDGEEKTYRVGDDLPGGATLDRVYRDRVILLRAGKRETLRLRDPERTASADSGASGAPRAAPARSGDSGNDLAATARRLRNDPAELARNFTAVPVQQDGRLLGVRLRSIGDGALLSRIGLRGTDVVTSVNGIPLNDPSRAGEVMNQLRSAGSFQVTVLRNGREQQINVSLDQ